jgi:SAM-dependent methyltransferase
VTDGDAAVDLDPREQRRAVRERYARIAAGSGDGDGCCTASGGGCCGDDAAGESTADAERAAGLVGYSEAELADAGGANLGLGCGNPTALAALSPGETVLDLGSGAGFDCFLAAREVGDAGRVIGVDMTPEMVERARDAARENGAGNVEFRLGEIEHLPVADRSVDVVVSNCVINLSPDKPRVVREAHRVLRPGGRLSVTDVVLTADVPADLRADPDSVAACVAGAATIDRLETLLDDAGFEGVSIEPKADSDAFVREWDPDRDLSEFLVSARIEARKPAGVGASDGDEAGVGDEDGDGDEAGVGASDGADATPGAE